MTPRRMIPAVAVVLMLAGCGASSPPPGGLPTREASIPPIPADAVDPEQPWKRPPPPVPTNPPAPTPQADVDDSTAPATTADEPPCEKKATFDDTKQFTFEPGSHELTDAARQLLRALPVRLCGDLSTPIHVEGHTDSDGADPANEALGQRRADEVAAFLRNELNFIAVSTSSEGETQPVALNDTAAGKAANRRVFITTIT